VLSFFPTFFRILGLVFVLSLYALNQPLSVLPEGVHWTIDALHKWEVVSFGTWLTAVVLYLLYFGFSLVKNNLYTGQPGAEIHFMKHEKIVKTLRPGEGRFVLDPRVTDTYRLLERGGFEKFLRQLREVYESIIKDSVLNISAGAFNQFMVEPVAVPETREKASPSASTTLSRATSRWRTSRAPPRSRRSTSRSST